MKIPVTRGKIGTWRYYVGVMTFGQLAENVKPSINQLFTASCLDELLQRELTKNFKSIKDYLLKENDRFFNAIILAIFDGDPQWLEVEFKGEEQQFTNVGFLQFSGQEIIFPVDGQHRVAGIIEAVGENETLKNEQVPVIFIAHEDTDMGRKKTRKLFSTLNRRAKPVGQNENIAIDEDDVCAIITRELLQDLELFKGDNVINSLGKQIPSNNDTALTSLITLYQCVENIVKFYLSKQSISGKKYKEFLLYRPDERTIEELQTVVFNIMNSFVNNTTVILEYLNNAPLKKAARFRNRDGGNLLFRPVALTEYFNAAMTLIDNGYTYDAAFNSLNAVKLDIAETPWQGFLWDGCKIINRVSRNTIKDLLVYMVDKDLLSEKNINKMIGAYSTAVNKDIDTVKNILQSI